MADTQTAAQRNAAKEAKANEQAQLDAQQAQLDADIAARGPEKALGDLATKAGFKTPAQLKSFLDAAANATTDEEKSRILENELNVTMPVWFLEQRDNSYVPTGFRKFDDLVPIETVLNGAIRMDYNDIPASPDGKGVYHGAIKNSDGKSWVDVTQGPQPLADHENFETKITIHMLAMRFLALFTNAHKNSTLFLLQFSNLEVSLREPLLILLFGIRGKMLVDPANAFDNIKTSDDAIVINETQYPTPDYEIKAQSMKGLISQLNTYIMQWTSPSRNHFPDGSETASMMLINGGKGLLKKQLIRSIANMDDLQTVVSNNFMNLYNNFQISGAFHAEDAAILDKFRKSFRMINPKIDLGPDYANVKGFQDTMTSDENDVVSGSTDIIIKTKDFMKLIQQFSSENVFNTPVHTEVTNAWQDLGYMLNKKSNQFYMRLRLTVEPKATPDQKQEQTA